MQAGVFMSRLWTTWSRLNRAAEGRPVYLYGASVDWAPKAIEKLQSDVVAIIDKEAESLHSFEGIPTVSLDAVPMNDDPFIVVTTGSYQPVVNQLASQGLSPGDDVVCSPDFEDYASLEELKSLDIQVLFSSPDYADPTRARGSASGGGLFILKTASGDIERVYEGSIRQFERLSDGTVLLVDGDDGSLSRVNESFDPIRTVELDGTQPCGLAVNEADGVVYVIDSKQDTIHRFTLDELSTIDVSYFTTEAKSGHHHVNDCCVHEGMLYLSYFSFSGNFRKRVFDGGVAAYDFAADGALSELISGLYKPHSPCVIDGDIHVVDSMTGRVLRGDKTTVCTIPGFARGLNKTAEFYVVGQSENMYLSEMQLQESTLMLNCGIHVVNPTADASLFFDVSQVTNIHEVAVY